MCSTAVGWLLLRRMRQPGFGEWDAAHFGGRIGTYLKMHATPIFTVRKSMNFSENQQSPAQTILYGMKHDPNTANTICRIKVIQCKQRTHMHFSMHYNADPGRSWNNTPGVFRAETNDHQWISIVESPCVGITVFATPACGFKTKCCSKPWTGNQWQTLEIDESDENQIRFAPV